MYKKDHLLVRIEAEDKGSTYITRLEVESGGIEVKGFGEVGDTHSKMTYLVHWGRAFYSNVLGRGISL